MAAGQPVAVAIEREPQVRTRLEHPRPQGNLN